MVGSALLFMCGVNGMKLTWTSTGLTCECGNPIAFASDHCHCLCVNCRQYKVQHALPTFEVQPLTPPMPATQEWWGVYNAIGALVATFASDLQARHYAVSSDTVRPVTITITERTPT